MKKVTFALFLFLCLSAFNNLSAQDYKTALGIRLSNSNPLVSNSISLKHFLNEKTAIEGLFSFGDPLSIGGLVEFHKPFSTPGLQWYYGAGGYLGFGKDYDPAKAREVRQTYFGGMGVAGLDFKFANIPLNLSLDWKPELNIVPEINFEPAAIGFTARFTLGKSTTQ
ncbi:MAG: hypothetical protein C4308_11240 [Chitinophagaceae bacterium]